MLCISCLDNSDSDDSNNTIYIIAAAGGGLFILLVIVIIIVTAIACKKCSKSRYNFYHSAKSIQLIATVCNNQCIACCQR